MSLLIDFIFNVKSGGIVEQQKSATVLKALTDLHNTILILKFHTYDPISVILESVHRNLETASNEVRIMMGCKLLDY